MNATKLSTKLSQSVAGRGDPLSLGRDYPFLCMMKINSAAGPIPNNQLIIPVNTNSIQTARYIKTLQYIECGIQKEVYYSKAACTAILKKHKPQELYHNRSGVQFPQKEKWCGAIQSPLILIKLKRKDCVFWVGVTPQCQNSLHVQFNICKRDTTKAIKVSRKVQIYTYCKSQSSSIRRTVPGFTYWVE